MHDLLLGLMYSSILCMFMECWIVFRNIKTPLHSYLFLSCIATLVNSIGYLLQLKSKCEDSYMNALRLSYSGRTFIALAMLFFIAELCHVVIPSLIAKSLVIVHVAVYVLIMTISHHSLYYRNGRFETGGMFPVYVHKNGIVFIFFMHLLIIYVIVALYWLILSLIREKSATARKRLLLVLAALVSEGMSIVIQLWGRFSALQPFDFSILGLAVGMVFMYIAIFRYNLLGVMDIAREFMIDRLAEGVIAVDNEGNVKYFNEPARTIFPELYSDPASVVKQVKEAVSAQETINANNRIYSPEENELKVKGESFGKLYALLDATEHKEKEQQLRADADILEMAAISMRKRLLAAEEAARQDRRMRHDRRHFEALLMELLKEGRTEEAKRCLSERLLEEPKAEIRYCDNTTVNASFAHYVFAAKSKAIRVEVSANIPEKIQVDEIKLAIAISNLMENAIHACEKVEPEKRYISVRSSYKTQLLIEISNSCRGTVRLDQDGYPFTDETGHGIGTKSVRAFVRQTGSEIRYFSKEDVFRVRMLIG